MNKDNFELAAKIVGQNYASAAQNNRRAFEKKVHHFLEQRKLPDEGWSDAEIRLFLSELALMDSNNFASRAGVGEREGRVLSSIVSERHFGLSHGIGRSGDIAAVQPKAAGSSLVAKLANAMVLDVLKMAGVPGVKDAVIIPAATGMTLTLCFLLLKKKNPSRNCVIWPRIDQKSCFKSMLTAGLTPLIVEPKIVGDELRTDVAAVEKLLEEHKGQVLAVLSTTSCFAPRVCDKIVELAELCRTHDVPHVVNNAYGVQAARCMGLIQTGATRGRVDFFVQSTDKNFLVPVGGAIVASSNKALVDAVCKLYAGRASATPSLDVLITLLGLGRSGFQRLVAEQKACYAYLSERMASLSAEFDERMLTTPGNPISLAMTLNHVTGDPKDVGAQLFTRGCSGARVVVPSEEKNIEGFLFKNFGAHSNESATPYLNCAASVGQTKAEIDSFLIKLTSVLKKKKKATSTGGDS